MTGQDDQLEEWIIRDDISKERLARIVLPSSERLVAESPGDGEAALESVAAWMSDQRGLPIVELATLSPRAITFTFAEPAVLSEPWVSQAGGSGRAHDQWGITLQHAMSLPHGDGHGWQMAGMTGMGTLADGSRAFINTSRWGILGIAGTPEWARDLMITQVMNQAAEPWSKGQVIWLVGYGETADKLINFLSPYHPHYRFKTAETLNQIKPVDLELVSATIYVMGSSTETEKQYTALNSPHVGIITDQIITDQCMFLSERSGGSAVLGPFTTSLKIFPNSSPELIAAMENAWDANERLVTEKAAAADFSELFTTSPSAPVETNKSEAEIKADFDALVTQFEDSPSSGSNSENATTTPGECLSDDPAREVVETPTEVPADALPENVTKTEDGDNAISEDVATTGDEESTEDVAVEELQPPTVNATDSGSSGTSSRVHLTLLGKVHARNSSEELKGRHSAALALLWLSDAALSPQEISEKLWPADESEGHTARTRRSRLLAKIRECVGDAISADAVGWSLDREQVSTDYDQVVSTLTNESLNQQKEAVMDAINLIDIPLHDADQWAAEYRDQMCERLRQILADLKDRALDEDAFDIAKAAKMATTKLGES